MYSEKIEKLIDLALADGELTEKEKQILFKNAETEGIDLDEFEMVLEAKLYEKQQQKVKKTETPPVAPKSEKYGDVRKCPACGAIVKAFTIQCSDCGYEITNVAANNSVKILSEKLEKANDNTKGDIIKNFPIPNTKEDILEFLHFIGPKTKTGFNSEDNKNVDAWKNKFTEVLTRAEFIFANDTKMKSEIEKLKKQYNSSEFTSFVITFLKKYKKTIIFCAILIGLFAYIGSCNNRKAKSAEREKTIFTEAESFIKQGNLSKADSLVFFLKKDENIIKIKSQIQLAQLTSQLDSIEKMLNTKKYDKIKLELEKTVWIRISKFSEWSDENERIEREFYKVFVEKKKAINNQLPKKYQIDYISDYL